LHRRRRRYIVYSVNILCFIKFLLSPIRNRNSALYLTVSRIISSRRFLRRTKENPESEGRRFEEETLRKEARSTFWTETLKLKKIEFFFGPFCDREDNIQKKKKKRVSLWLEEKKKRNDAHLCVFASALSFSFLRACVCACVFVCAGRKSRAPRKKVWGERVYLFT